MMIDPRGIHSYAAEKIRDSDESLILGFVGVVFYQNQRLLTVEPHPVVAPVGSSLFEREDLTGRMVEVRKPFAGL
jgi:hypothetical protein